MESSLVISSCIQTPPISFKSVEFHKQNSCSELRNSLVRQFSVSAAHWPRQRLHRRSFSLVVSCSHADANYVWHTPGPGPDQLQANQVPKLETSEHCQEAVPKSPVESRNGGTRQPSGQEESGREPSARAAGEGRAGHTAGSGSTNSRRGLDDDLFSRAKKFVGSLAAFLPGGSWWRVAIEDEEEDHRESLKRVLARLWQLMAPDKLLLSLAFLFLMISALAEIAIPHFVAATLFSASNGFRSKFYANARTLSIVVAVFGVFSGLRGGSFTVINQRLVQRMRKRLFTTLVSQDIAFFDSEAVGDLTSRLSSDCQQISRIVGGDINIMFRNAVQGVVALAYLLRLSGPLALLTASLSAVLWLGIDRFGRFQRQAAKVVQDTTAAANEVAEETFSLVRVVRAFGTEAQEAARYDTFAEKLLAVGLRKSVAYGFGTWGSNTLYSGVEVVALVLGGALLLAGSLTAEQLTKYIWYAESVVHRTWWVGEHWASLMEAMGASERVLDLLDRPRAQQLTSAGRILPHLEGRIEFQNVGFSYPTRPTVAVLQNVSLVVQPGQLVALVGLSGSGKSTLVALLQRLYEPSQGQVLLDGVPLDELDTAWFRQQIGVVSQEPRLFSTDIASNIAYGAESDLGMEAIVAAAQQANAHDFITGLPQAYQSPVDNSRLSGGQKQRIAIARALVRDPKILILDEATSALDAESEHSVQVALDRAMRDDHGRRRRTVLVIAHRLSTVRKADCIVVMKGGQIKEMGTHKELLALNGEYARLNYQQLNTIDAL